MKKTLVLCIGLCSAFVFTGCKSSESAYKKAYEKAQEHTASRRTTNDCSRCDSFGTKTGNRDNRYG